MGRQSTKLEGQREEDFSSPQSYSPKSAYGNRRCIAVYCCFRLKVGLWGQR